MGGSADAPDEDDSSSVADPLTEDDGLEAGVNYTDDAKDSEPEVEVIETNESAGSSGLGSCAAVVGVKQTSVLHPDYADSSTSVSNLFDSDLATYYSVNRESTHIIMELEEEVEVNGMAIGFFMKSADEERIQVFDIAVRKASDDDWKTVVSRKESSGEMDVVQTFPFSSRTALYVRLETHGNDYNNWSAFTEVEVCTGSGEESNALFGGAHAAGQELEVLAGEVCLAPALLAPVSAKASGTDNVRMLFDGNFLTRWSTVNTQSDSDLNNAMVHLTFQGDTRVSTLKIAFFDGHLAHQFFSVYVQSANAHSWTPVLQNEQAAMVQSMQTFSIEMDGVHKLYIVGKGNDVGLYSKFSEVQVYGC